MPYPLTIAMSTDLEYLACLLRIRETLNNLILKSPQEWQTSVGLPFVRIEGKHATTCIDAVPSYNYHEH